jgi:hypothetical protein
MKKRKPLIPEIKLTEEDVKISLLQNKNRIGICIITIRM